MEFALIDSLIGDTFKANGIMGIGPSALDREYILDKIFKDRKTWVLSGKLKPTYWM